MSRRSPKKSKGFSLIELMLSLGVGAIIVGAVWWKFNNFQTGFRAQQHSNAVKFIMDGADNVYAHNVEFATVNDAGTKTLANASRVMTAITGEVPAEIYLNGANYQHYWGGNWTVSTASSTGALQDLLAVQLTNIPEVVCRDMIVSLAPEMYDVRVNNNLVSLEKNDNQTPVWRSTVNLTKSYPLCRSGNNTLIFRKLKELNLAELRRMKPFHNALTPEEQGLNRSARRYRVDYLSQHNRLQQAYQNRENAQAALD